MPCFNPKSTSSDFSYQDNFLTCPDIFLPHSYSFSIPQLDSLVILRYWESQYAALEEE